MSESLSNNEHPQLLLFRLADFAIESANDVGCLWNELESIAEDYPEYIPVAVVGHGEL